MGTADAPPGPGEANGRRRHGGRAYQTTESAFSQTLMPGALQFRAQGNRIELILF
jgi:hypothetical protein